MERTKKVYYDELNIYRALIIFWVVAGHSFEEGTDIFGFFHNYAYTFHMPAFFVISGFLLAPKLKKINGIKETGLAILDRAKRLLVPFYFFSAVSVVLKIIFNRFAKNPFVDDYSLLDFITGANNPNGGLWFLTSLFIISVFLILLHRLPSIAVFIITVVLKVLTLFYSPNILTCFFFFYYSIYVSAGVLIRNYYQYIQKAIKLLIKKRTLSICVTSVLFAVSFVLSIYCKRMGNLAYLYRVFNIVIWFILAVLLNEFEKIKKPFMTMGSYGMDIYVLGYYVQIAIRVIFAQIFGLPVWIYSPMMLIFGLVLPIPISKYFVRKFKLTSALMLGSFPKKDK